MADREILPPRPPIRFLGITRSTGGSQCTLTRTRTRRRPVLKLLLPQRHDLCIQSLYPCIRFVEILLRRELLLCQE